MDCKLLLGKILTPLSPQRCEFYPEGAMLIKEGIIVGLGAKEDILSLLPAPLPPEQIIDHSEHFILPGLWDLHFHWVQNQVRTMPKDSLLQWLSRYTWPYEAKFADHQFSLQSAQDFFPLLAEAGTVGGAIYGSVHSHTVTHALERAQGHFVAGNVLMTMNSPQNLLQTAEDALCSVRELSARFGPRYALTPRFALTTHPQVMEEAAQWVAPLGCFIQTHLSETREEIQSILEIYRQLKKQREFLKPFATYTDIYRQCQILSPRTILGHCLHLDHDELQILAQTGTAIAHCPTSNAPCSEGGLGSGLFDFRQAEKYGLPWALGSDIGGGPHLSLFDVMNSFVMQNRSICPQVATYTKALYHATVASAQILHKGDLCGNLARGKEASFIVLKTPPTLANKKTLPPIENILEHLISQKGHCRQDYQFLVQGTYFKGERIFPL